MKHEISRQDWEAKAQPGELVCHEVDEWRKAGKLEEETEVLFPYFGFSHNDYVGKTVIDAGCGSRLRTKFFTGSNIIGIDPLIDGYLKIEWSDLKVAKMLFSLPLEDRIEELKETADLIISINVLDHCFNFLRCLENLHYYLKSDGVCFISYDEHVTGANDMHPLDLDDKISRDLITKAGFKIKKFRRGKVYGGGESALSYWLYK